MTREEHIRKAEAWVRQVEREVQDQLDEPALLSALYTFSELRLWKMDVEIKDIPEAIRVWAVVESVLNKGFPKKLGM